MTKHVVTSIRVNEELWKKAKKYVIDKGITLTELIDQLLRKELKESLTLRKRSNDEATDSE